MKKEKREVLGNCPTVEPTEELEPLFYYKRVQPFAVVSLDDDEDDDATPAPKRKKVEEDDDVKVTKVVNHEANNDDDEDWLPPPPKVSVDVQNQLGEDSTLKELRLKKQELEALRRPAGDILREVEESVRMELGNSLLDSPEVVVKKAPKPACERPKIVISIQDKNGSQSVRVFKDDKFEQIFKRYAEKIKCDVQSLVFSFDGDKIGGKATPESLGMEDDDIIEVLLKGR